jgi:hypothetical protein
LLAHVVPDGAHKVLINPWLKLAHPASMLVWASSEPLSG